MHRPVEDTNKFVYHYTKAKVAINNILNEGHLRFSPYNKTNDPLETKSWYLNITDGVDRVISELNNIEKKNILDNLLDFSQTQKNILNDIKSIFKIICFTRDNPNQLKSPTLISSFLRGWGHPRMWAQYAENHEGVCLMFDRNKLNEVIKENFKRYKIYQGEMKYLNEPIPEVIKSIKYEELIKIGIKKIIQKKIEENINRFFFQKSFDWQEEFEYRWLIESNENLEEYLYIPINNAIRAIILGTNVVEDNENKLIDYSKKFKVRIYKMDWMNGTPIANKSPYQPWVYDFPNPV